MPTDILITAGTAVLATLLTLSALALAGSRLITRQRHHPRTTPTDHRPASQTSCDTCGHILGQHECALRCTASACACRRFTARATTPS